MRLVSLTVENFRSITAARKISIAQITTLIGPNNEGKSNLLRALAIGVNTLVKRRLRRTPTRMYITGIGRKRRNDHEYVWEADYPLRLQASHPNKSSNITLEFELSEQEVEEFARKIGSRLNGTLPIAIAYRRGETRVSIAKQGRGHKVLNAKTSAIEEFVSDRLEIQYIPAVRNADAAQGIVDQLVATELAKLEEDHRYTEALAEIAQLQEPVLEALSASITATMQKFLPQISSAKIAIGAQNRSVALRTASEIFVDDGAETLLEYKGDGVQSLAALAIMRHASQAQHHKKEVIIALEEPESHLHPRAIRELKVVLNELSTNHQVVLTTHNALFSNRIDVSSNIIVRNNRAFSARSIRDVRDALGVRLEDNLTSAEVVLLVEGEEDRISLRSILAEIEPNIASALKVGRIAIDVLGGAGNLTHRARLHGDTLCRVHAFVDNDQSGLAAYNNAVKDGVLNSADVTFARCGGKVESELEDLYAEHVYSEILRAEAGLALQKQGPDKDKKWTDRVKNLLRIAGKAFDETTLLAIKIKVAHAASTNAGTALHPSKDAPLRSLASQLAAKLAEATSLS
jgi:predicted ATP-dependent endonuclease of OLD family